MRKKQRNQRFQVVSLSERVPSSAIPKIFLFYILLTTSRIPRFFFLDLSEPQSQKYPVPPKPYKHLGTAENCYIVINRRCFLVGVDLRQIVFGTTVDSPGGASEIKEIFFKYGEKRKIKRPRTSMADRSEKSGTYSKVCVFLSLLGLER